MMIDRRMKTSFWQNYSLYSDCFTALCIVNNSFGIHWIVICHCGGIELWQYRKDFWVKGIELRFRSKGFYLIFKIRSYFSLKGAALQNLCVMRCLFLPWTIYRKVASSRPVYYSILNSFGQRSQYISIKFPFHKQSENP